MSIHEEWDDKTVLNQTTDVYHNPICVIGSSVIISRESYKRNDKNALISLYLLLVLMVINCTPTRVPGVSVCKSYKHFHLYMYDTL